MKHKTIWKRLLALFLLLAIVAAVIPTILVSANVTNNAYLQELPDSYKASDGKFVLASDSRIFIPGTIAPDDDFAKLAQFISQQFGAGGFGFTDSLPIVYGAEDASADGDIIISIDNTVASGKAEGYKIVVADGQVRIIGADSRGLMYGAFMVIKMFRANGSATLGGCTITDAPEAEERTVMLDCGRKYFTAEWIKNYIREMAYMGYNTFEMHFAEDQGFRLDIWDENYFTSPNGNDFSWACGGMVGSWVASAYQDYDDVGKYLTTKEMVEILEVAKQYQIDVVPSFDTPMHCQYLRRAWSARVGGDVASELGGRITVDLSTSFVYNGKKYSSEGITDLSTGKTTKYDESINVWDNIMVKNNNGVRSGTKVIDVTNAVGRNLMLALIEDFAAFFKKYGCSEFNICADEVAFYELDYQKTYAQSVLGITNGSKYDTFTHYVNEVTNMLQDKYGYRVRIFSDFVDRDGSGGTNYIQHLTFDEELEIVYWWLPEDNSVVRNVTHFVDKKYTIYNAVENYNYYVLALYNGKDDRGGVRSTWTHVTAQKNYENWNPTVFTHPTSGSTNIVDASKVSGGYFLIWADYGAMSTESQIWNGIDSSGTYNVIERMWSNCYKMWDYDLNSKLSYTNFDTVTTSFGHYPGYTDCTKAISLPAASDITRVYGVSGLCVYHKTMVGGTEQLIAFENIDCNVGSNFTYEFYDRYGYSFDYVEGATTTEEIKYQTGCYFTEHASGADGGTIYGVLEDDLVTVTIWYDNQPNISTLEELVKEAVTNQGSFTDESWATYSAALHEATTLYNSASADTTWQEQVDIAEKALLDALAGLEASISGETEILSLKMTTTSVTNGRYAVLMFSTTADVSLADLKILDASGNEIPIASYGTSYATNEAGETVKQWRIRFIANKTEGYEGSEEFTYTLHAGSAHQEFTFTCS